MYVVLLSIAAAGCQASQAGSVPDPRAPASGAQAVAGEVIVRLRPQAGERLAEALRAGRPATRTGIAWFDALGARFGLSAIEPVFGVVQDPETVRRRFPARARRAPAGSQAPDLEHVYRLRFSPDIIPQAAAAAYGAQPEVEYAQPNYLATIQQPAPAE